MNCGSCGRANPADARFCSACGAPLLAQPANPSRTLAGGRYQVLREVGRGGRKIAYLARDSRLDRDVVVSVLNGAELDGDERERIRREARAMARLGQHRNLVTVFDFEESAGEVSIVSEWISGGDLATRLAQSPGGRVPLLEAVHIARDVARGLAHAHARGVIHRDVKPANVYLGEDGTARVGDFGLALAPHDRDYTPLGEGGRTVGTIAYMPPEQVLGERPSPQSDLYALGATLFELLVGEPPFAGPDALKILKRHVGEAPVAPSARNPDVPGVLDALVLELLAKAPESRPSTAALVAERLDRIAAQLDAGVALERGAVAEDLPSALVGRELELERLRAALSDALAGRRRHVSVRGEAGMGKTRLLEELARMARRNGAAVVNGQGRESAPPYWPWREVLASLAAVTDDATLRADVAVGAELLVPLVPELSTRSVATAASTIASGEEARFRLADAVKRWLFAAAARRPLVVILDDLHWADHSSLRLLDFVARAAGGGRLLLVSSFRAGELPPDDPRAALLEGADDATAKESLELSPLSATDIDLLCWQVYGRALGAGLAVQVREATGGNAFFVHEVLRLFEAQGRFAGASGVAETTGDGVEIPASAAAVVAHRLADWPESALEVLRTAALTGIEFDPSVVAEVLGSSGERVTETLARGRELRLVRPSGSGVTHRFEHAIVRDALVKDLPAELTMDLHLRIAHALEARVDSRPDLLPALAEHLHAALPRVDPERACLAATRAARIAGELLAFDEAAAHFARALAACELMGAADEKRAELATERARALAYAGNSSAAVEAAYAAVERARSAGRGDLLCQSALIISWAHYMYGGADAARLPDLFREGLDAPGVAIATRAELAARLTMLHGIAARYELARAVLLELESMVPPDAPHAVRAHVHCGRHWYASTRAPAAATESGFVGEMLAAAEALDSLPPHGDDWLRRVAIAARLESALHLGDAEGVERALAALEAFGERTHLARDRFSAQIRRSMWCLTRGAIQDGERHAFEAFTLAVQSKIPSATHPLGLILQPLRELQGRADELVPAIRDMVATSPDSPGTPTGRAMLAAAHAAAGRADEARAQIDVLARDNFASLARNTAGLPAISFLARAICELRDRPRARGLYELASARDGAAMIVPGPIAFFGSTSLPLGMLASLLERFADAERHFLEAIRFHAKLGAEPLLAHSRSEYARMCVTRRARGDSELAIELSNQALRTSRDLGLAALTEQALAAKLAAQGVDVADTNQSIHVVASSVGRRSDALHTPSSAGGEVTLLFSDLVGFTALINRSSDAEAHRIVRMHNAIVREQVAKNGGYEVELQGDGFLLAFASPLDGVRCAVDIQTALTRDLAAPAGEELRARIGVHTGEVIRDADKFFGSAVIKAYRIADRAEGREILVSDAVARSLQSHEDPELRLGTPRRVELRGFEGEHEVWPIDWRSGVDP